MELGDIIQKTKNKSRGFVQMLKERGLLSENLEYTLGGLELFLAIHFFLDLANFRSISLITKLIDVVAFVFTAPFFVIFGKDPSYALSLGELETLAAALVYPTLIWSYMFISKRLANRPSRVQTSSLSIAA
ncbi:MAG: hypothetical protein JWO40_294 [Candidatus Doudnabacteria bacterium]|nr:hypothetical protein [Candidatus Doudnabacteria bacterium]